MRRALAAMGIFCLSVGLLVCGCGDTPGPRIVVDQNLRNLCNFSISGVEEEVRCADDNACTQSGTSCVQPEATSATDCTADDNCETDELCYRDHCFASCEVDADCADKGDNLRCIANGDGTGNKTCRRHGYCRACASDPQCAVGLVCDNGWCRSPCSRNDECDAGLLCTGDVCRPPHTTVFSFCNHGDRELQIFTSQTEVLGDADAAVFCDLEWAEGKDPIEVASDGCTLLRISFRPTDLGAFRAWINIYSNDETLSPLWLMLCGQAVANKCNPTYDVECPPCPDCRPVEFEDYASKPNVCQ